MRHEHLANLGIKVMGSGRMREDYILVKHMGSRKFSPSPILHYMYL